METEWLYAQEHEALRHAWNLIQESKSGLPKEVFRRISKVLIELDAAIYQLHPPHTEDVVTIFNPDCGHCVWGRGA